jgi:hypothetical protein
MYLSQHVKELQSIYLLYSSEQTLDTWTLKLPSGNLT